MAVRNLDKFVRRYTTLSSALDTLVHRRLVLLSPSKWDDTNDADFMELYRDHIGASSILALCCAMASETYHHWRVFTQGMEGICIEFEREGLERSLSGNSAITFGPVDYLLVKDLEALDRSQAGRLPFIKRDGYSDEREWRIIASSSDKPKLALEVPIGSSSISRLIFNPWLPPSLAENLRDIIKKMPGCSGLKIESSALTNSARWKAAGKNLVG